MTSKEHEMTSEEKKLYDRQLRIWGHDSQKKLKKARVLIVGIDGLTIEIAKNLILGGVGSLTVIDIERPVSKMDRSEYLFISPSIKTLPTALTLHTLNALVNVSYIPLSSSFTITHEGTTVTLDKFIQRHTLVVAASHSLPAEHLRHLDSLTFSALVSTLPRHGSEHNQHSMFLGSPNTHHFTANKTAREMTFPRWDTALQHMSEEEPHPPTSRLSGSAPHLPGSMGGERVHVRPYESSVAGGAMARFLLGVCMANAAPPRNLLVVCAAEGQSWTEFCWGGRPPQQN